MSLTGTLETFALPDVLALLAATRKTGELKVNGGRGDARVWLDKGEMVAADVPRAITFVDAVFEMLRLTSGKFAFDNDGQATDPGEPMALEPLLLEAQSRLGEWRSIESVVPSTACGVSLVPTVAGPQVSLTAEQWRALVAVATNRDVEAVTVSLGLGEFAGCRMVKDLVQSGLVAIGEAPAPEAVAATEPEPAPESTASPEATASPGSESGSTASPEATPEPAPVAGSAGAASVGAPDDGIGSSTPSRAPARPVNPSVPAAAVSGFKPAAQVAKPAAAGASPAAAGATPAAAGATPAVRPTTPAAAGTEMPAPASTRPRLAAHLGGDPAPAAAAATPTQKQPAVKAPVRAEVRDTAPQPATDRGTDASPAEEAAELVHQLAHLGDAPTPTPTPATSPQGAPAADPAASTTDPEPGEEPINRGLLLKFLNSVRS